LKDASGRPTEQVPSASGSAQDNERTKSQILGIILIAFLLLVVACIRYYFRLG
jgi:hypothetical protein